LATFTRARARLEAKRPRGANRAYPLNHVAPCATCGGSLTGSQGSRPMYRCFTPTCAKRTTVTAERLHEHLRCLLHDAAIDASGELEALADGVASGRLVAANDEPLRAAESALRSAELAGDEFAKASARSAPRRGARPRSRQP
jgi:hypothetical protein